LNMQTFNENLIHFSPVVNIYYKIKASLPA